MAPYYSWQAPSQPCADRSLLPLLQPLSFGQTSRQEQTDRDFFPHSSKSWFLSIFITILVSFHVHPNPTHPPGWLWPGLPVDTQVPWRILDSLQSSSWERGKQFKARNKGGGSFHLLYPWAKTKKGPLKLYLRLSEGSQHYPNTEWLRMCFKRNPGG